MSELRIIDYEKLHDLLDEWIVELSATSGCEAFCPHCRVRREHKAKLEKMIQQCETGTIVVRQ